MTPILAGIVASGISGHLTPPFTPTGSYDALATYTVPSGGVSQIVFSGLAFNNEYTHLQIRGIARDTWSASGFGEFYLYPNADTSSLYADHGLYGSGGAPGAYGYASRSDGMFVGNMVRNGSLASAFGGFVIDILDYASNKKFKTARALSGSNTNGSGTILLQSGLWRSTTPITSLRLTPNGVAFAEHTQISIYGVKG